MNDETLLETNTVKINKEGKRTRAKNYTIIDLKKPRKKQIVTNIQRLLYNENKKEVYRINKEIKEDLIKRMKKNCGEFFRENLAIFQKIPLKQRKLKIMIYGEDGLKYYYIIYLKEEGKILKINEK